LVKLSRALLPGRLEFKGGTEALGHPRRGRLEFGAGLRLLRTRVSNGKTKAGQPEYRQPVFHGKSPPVRTGYCAVPCRSSVSWAFPAARVGIWGNSRASAAA